MWMVYDSEEGVVLITDKYDEAQKVYEEHVGIAKQFVQEEGEFITDDEVILSEVKKRTYPHDTKKPVVIEDEDGTEIKTGETYWDWKEDIYDKED